MRDGLRDKQTHTLNAINYSTVEIVDDTPPVIDAKARYRSIISIIAILPIPLALDALVRGSPSECYHKVWWGKTMVWLPDGEKNWRYVYSFRQNTRTWQTDRQTDDTVQRHRPRLRKHRAAKISPVGLLMSFFKSVPKSYKIKVFLKIWAVYWWAN